MSRIVRVILIYRSYMLFDDNHHNHADLKNVLKIKNILYFIDRVSRNSQGFFQSTLCISPLPFKPGSLFNVKEYVGMAATLNIWGSFHVLAT
jgi:hypothetical protein